MTGEAQMKEKGATAKFVVDTEEPAVVEPKLESSVALAALPEAKIELSLPEPEELDSAAPPVILPPAKPQHWAKSAGLWFWDLRVPILVLMTVGVVHKFVIFWIAFVLFKPVIEAIYRRSPQAFKQRLRDCVPKPLRDNGLINDLNEGADQSLPFILVFVYICLWPFAVGWMFYDWVKSFRKHADADKQPNDNELLFQQNRRKDQWQQENNFYHSKVFGIVVLLFFLSGVPALFSWHLYERFNIGQHVQETGHPIDNSLYFRPAPPPPHVPTALEHGQPDGGDVDGYLAHWTTMEQFATEPTNKSVFLVHFYLMSVAFAACAIFFRAWFTFPLKFLTDEHDVVFTEYGIKRKTFRGWLRSVITANGWATGGGPDSLKWGQVKCVRRLEEGYTKLYPLPDTAFKKESLSYKILNKIAAFIDGFSRRIDQADYLLFSESTANNDYGHNIKVNLKDMSREQRARLFYSVKKWAPHVDVRQSAEEQLLGSTVLRDNRYTQLWFDMLTTKVSRRQNVLDAGELLKEGEYAVQERLSSGGQATAYVARNKAGETCVLKEFVLSVSSENGALLESAREFESEVSLLSQLQHDGIVKLQDFFFEKGRVYVVLEHIEGVSLKQVVQEKGPLSEPEVKRITEAICDVLTYMHTRVPPIVHRDITPENILLRPDGTIKLIDFSLAVKQDGKPVTESCGKQCFTPPEQFRDEVCPQSDIYALGATMFYLLTGVTPKPISISSPRDKAPQLSETMNKIVQRATQLDLTQRYESAHWLKLDLSEQDAR